MASAPRVFVSYSHDSPAHKQWVASLSSRLRASGIDALLDQWDLNLGDDVTQFMEAGVSSSDRVLVVCTDEYVRKADAGKGGVGYERLIVTAELVQNIGTNKFIPIIRNADHKHKTPRFLGTRLYTDFSDDSQFDEKCDELIRELHKAPALTKPALGQNPFAVTPSGEESQSPINPPIEIGDQLEDPVAVYDLAVSLARNNDLSGWRQLIKRIRRPVSSNLFEWRRRYESDSLRSVEDLQAAADVAVRMIAPLLVVALAGVESGRAEFADQRALLDEVYEIDGWNLGGLTMLVDLPYFLAYVYQALHGSICLYTGQVELALDFADMQIREKYDGEHQSIWRTMKIIGWPETLSGNCVTSWEFLTTAPNRWPWLIEIFGSERDFRISLSAYYMALNVYELSTDVAANGAKAFENGPVSSEQIFLYVPVNYLNETSEIQRRAVTLLIGNRRAVNMLWERNGVSRLDLERIWTNWMQTCKAVAARYKGPYFFAGYGRVAQEDFFKLLGTP
jgi:hypothetical protein